MGSEEEEEEVPARLCCTITHDVMGRPVVARDGHTYDEAAIREGVRRHRTSPVTREFLADGDWFVSLRLKGEIEEWQAHRARQGSRVALCHVHAHREEVSHLLSRVEALEERMAWLSVDPGADVNVYDGQGYTKLIDAAALGTIGEVRRLLAAPGIDVNKGHALSGETPLCCASWNGHTGAVCALLADPSIDVNKACAMGLTPVMLAANGAIKRLLRAAGAR